MGLGRNAVVVEPMSGHITLVHDGGQTKLVENLGIRGEPLRPHIQWPVAGIYEVSIYTGRLVGARGPKGQSMRRWKVSADDLKALRAEWRQIKKGAAPPKADENESGADGYVATCDGCAAELEASTDESPTCEDCDLVLCEQCAETHECPEKESDDGDSSSS